MLSSIANIKQINERMNCLYERYINSASISIPLIKQLYKEYETSVNSILKNDSYSTPLIYIFSFITNSVINNVVECVASLIEGIT